MLILILPLRFYKFVIQFGQQFSETDIETGGHRERNSETERLFTETEAATGGQRRTMETEIKTKIVTETDTDTQTNTDAAGVNIL